MAKAVGEENQDMQSNTENRRNTQNKQMQRAEGQSIIWINKWPRDWNLLRARQSVVISQKFNCKVIWENCLGLKKEKKKKFLKSEEK